MCQVNSSGTTMGPLADIWQTSGIDIGGGDHAGISGRYLEHLWNTSGTPLEVFPEVFQRSARYLTEVPISIPGRSQFTWNMLQKVFQRSSRGVPEVFQRSARGLPEVFQRSKTCLCASVLRSLRTGVLPPHWALGVSMTHGRCHFGSRSPSHELRTQKGRARGLGVPKLGVGDGEKS